MQAIADAVRHHRWFVQGEPLDPETVDRVAEKMTKRYPDLLISKDAAYRRRLDGKPVYYMVILRPSKRTSSGGFWLFTSLPEDPSEKWQKVTDRHNRPRIYWWELVRHPRAGKASPAWTWRMQPDVKERLEQQITEAVAKHWDEWLGRFVAQSRHWPGFAGVRQDHRELMLLIKRRWQRVRSGLLPWPLPKLLYVRRISHKDTTTKTKEGAG